MSQPSAPGGHPSATPQPQATGTQPSAAQPETSMKTYTQADVEAMLLAASATATTAERARLTAIQTHPNAHAQPGIVQLCIDTGIAAEQATAMLSAATSAAAPAPNPFIAAMAATPNPKVSGIETPPDATASDPAAQAAAMAAGILAAYRVKA